MHKILEVKPLENYKVWIKFSDGIKGIVDLSDLVGKGVFSTWKDVNIFNAVFIDPESHTIAWPGGIDLCPDTLYAKVLGVDPLSIFKKEATVNH